MDIQMLIGEYREGRGEILASPLRKGEWEGFMIPRSLARVWKTRQWFSGSGVHSPGATGQYPSLLQEVSGAQGSKSFICRSSSLPIAHIMPESSPPHLPTWHPHLVHGKTVFQETGPWCQRGWRLLTQFILPSYRPERRINSEACRRVRVQQRCSESPSFSASLPNYLKDSVVLLGWSAVYDSKWWHKHQGHCGGQRGEDATCPAPSPAFPGAQLHLLSKEVTRASQVSSKGFLRFPGKQTLGHTSMGIWVDLWLPHHAASQALQSQTPLPSTYTF